MINKPAGATVSISGNVLHFTWSVTSTQKVGCVIAVFNGVSKVLQQLLWFCNATLYERLKNLAPLSRPIKSKTKTNRDLLARVFPRLAPAACFALCFDGYIGLSASAICDWPE